MKNSRILSLILMLTMLISCFASLSIVNVSAHQNAKSGSDFENIKMYNTTSKRWEDLTDVLEVPTKEESISNGKVVYQARRYNGGGLDFDGISASAFNGVNYEYAPANVEKYGKVLKYYVMKDWTYDGVDYAPTSSTYFQKSINLGNKTFKGSVSIKASFYNNTTHYRSLRIHGEGTNSNQTIRFNEGGGSIAIFGGYASIAKKWSANKWYDVELKFNIDTKYYEFIVYEDGEFFGEISGVYKDSLYKSITGVDVFYNNTMNTIANSRDQITYFDNFYVESINELRPKAEQKEISYIDFEDFTGQTAGSQNDFPVSTEGKFTCGYQGNAEVSIIHAVKDDYNENWEKSVDFGTSAKLTSPIKPEGSTIDNGRYQYPSLRWSPNSAMTDNYRIVFDARFPFTSTVLLMFRSTGDAVFKHDAGQISIANDVVGGVTANSYDWYNFDILLDGDTGYYKATITNLTSPTANPAVEVEGMWSKLVDLMDNTNNSLYFQLNGNITAEQYVLLDNFYFGEYYESLMPASYEYNFEDGKNPVFVSTKWEGEVVVPGKTVTNSKSNTTMGTIDIPVPYGSYTAKIRFTNHDFNEDRKYISIGGHNAIILFASVDKTTGIGTSTNRVDVGGKPYSKTLETDGIYTVATAVGFNKNNNATSTLYDTDGTTVIGSYYSGAVGTNCKTINIRPTYSVWSGNDTSESSITIHDVTFSNISERASFTDTTDTGAYVIKSSATSATTTTIALPYTYANCGYQYQADFTFKDFGSAKTFKFGDTTIATVDSEGVLTVGEESMTIAQGANVALKLYYNKALSENVTVTITDGTNSISTTAAPANKIIVDAAEGESELYLENIKNTTIYTLKNDGGYAFDNFDVADSVNLEFKNVINAEDIKVYAPNGTINDAALVEASVAKSADGKTITINFDKEYDTHYHIAYTVVDEFGQTLTDVVELDTASAPSISDVAINVSDDTATASFTSTGKTGDIFFAIALYNGNELAKVVPSLITLSENDLDEEYTVSIEAPADGVNYTVKAFRWNASNQSPYEASKVSEATICVPLAQ